MLCPCLSFFLMRGFEAQLAGEICHRYFHTYRIDILRNAWRKSHFASVGTDIHKINYRPYIYIYHITCVALCVPTLQWETTFHHIYTKFLLVFLALQTIVVVFSQPSSWLSPPRFRGFLITHNCAPQSVGLIWTHDQLVAGTSIWQHTPLKTDKHASPGGIRTHDLSRRAAEDLRLRPRGHWNRHIHTK